MESGQLKVYNIIATSNLATKHPLFDYVRSFDFIIVTDVGLINVDVKHWNQKLSTTLMCLISTLI